MSTVNKFGTAKLLDSANVQYRGQERVNAEIFTAMELLGRKLERSEAERDRLARRLAQLESGATLDAATGKFFLPAVIDPAHVPANTNTARAPRWMLASTAFSTVLAFVALGIALFSSSGPQLTKEQLAALDALKGPQLAMVSPANAGWKQPETAPAADVAQTQDQAQPQATASAAPAADIATTEAVDENKAAVLETPAPQLTVPPQPEVAVVAPARAEETIKPDPALPKNLAALEQRAIDGMPEAQHDLATFYAAGSRVPRDYTRATFWFKKAAGRGIANAAYNLGVMYQQGLGVDANMKTAINWYEKAADTGHPEALYNLGIAYVQGVGIPADVDKGVAYFKRAANAGVAQAAYNLGVLYESNFVGSADAGKALEWYQVAAREGHADAKTAVARLNAASAQDLNAVEPAAGGNP